MNSKVRACHFNRTQVKDLERRSHFLTPILVRNSSSYFSILPTMSFCSRSISSLSILSILPGPCNMYSSSSLCLSCSSALKYSLKSFISLCLITYPSPIFGSLGSVCEKMVSVFSIISSFTVRQYLYISKCLKNES